VTCEQISHNLVNFGYFRLKVQCWAVLRMREQIPTRDQPGYIATCLVGSQKILRTVIIRKSEQVKEPAREPSVLFPLEKLPVLFRFKIRRLSEILKDNFVKKIQRTTQHWIKPYACPNFQNL